MKAYRQAGCFHDRSRKDKGDRGTVFITHRRAKARRALKALEHRNERRRLAVALVWVEPAVVEDFDWDLTRWSLDD